MEAKELQRIITTNITSLLSQAHTHTKKKIEF